MWALSLSASGSVWPGLSTGSTAGKLHDLGRMTYPLCALLFSSVKWRGDTEVVDCSEIIHINSLAQVLGDTN